MKAIFALVIGLIVMSVASLAQESKSGPELDESSAAGKNVIVKYKKYEKFDLGDLEIKGNVIAPGDLTVRDRGVAKFSRKLFDRFDFDREMEDQVRSLR